MNFAFTDQQRQIADMLKSALADLCGLTDLRKAVKTSSGFDSDRWRKLHKLELSASVLPDHWGGLGLSAADLVLLAEQGGYAALPEGLIHHIGVTLPLLAEIPGDQAQSLLRAARDDAAYIAIVDAPLALAHHADSAQAIIVIDRDRAGLADPSSSALSHAPSVDPLRRLFSVAAPCAMTALPGPIAVARDRAALYTAAQLLGVAQRAVDLAGQYAKDRQQFGRAIGGNQAVKHHLANALVKIEFARPVVYAAAAIVDRVTPPSRARVGHAKLAAADAALAATRAAHQIYGALGYSWEGDLHLFSKRALALADEWGTRAQCRARVAAYQAGFAPSPDRLFALDPP